MSRKKKIKENHVILINHVLHNVIYSETVLSWLFFFFLYIFDHFLSEQIKLFL